MNPEARPGAPAVPRWILVVAPALCLAGVGAAGYLTIAHYNAKVILACPAQGIINCAAVTASHQSMLLGLPVALLGLLYFAALLPLHLPAAWRSPARALRWARVLSATGGMTMVLYLVYTELFTLDAICLWCSAVHGLTFALFALTLIGTVQTSPDPELLATPGEPRPRGPASGPG